MFSVIKGNHYQVPIDVNYRSFLATILHSHMITNSEAGRRLGSV